MEDKQLKNDIAALENELQQIREKSTKIKGQLQEAYEKERELETLVRNTTINENEVFQQEKNHLPLKRYVDHLNEGIDYYEKEIEIWKNAHRTSLVGVKTAFLSKSDGSNIPNAEILEVGDEHLVIKSNGTEQKIPINELALPVRTKLVYEPDLNKE